MDRRAPSRVPWAASPETEELMEGRSGGGMPRVYCARCGRPNLDDARFCSNCGTQLVGTAGTGGITTSTPAGVTGGARPGETTSTWLNREDPDYGDDLFPDSASFGALPEGSALLIVMRGPNAGSRFRLEADLTTAGRHPDSDIFLDDVTVSRRHAEFYRHGGRFTVRDVGSLNGTYVNGARIEEAELAGGAEVQIGKFRLQFFSGSDPWGQPLSGGGMSGERYGRGAQGYV